MHLFCPQSHGKLLHAPELYKRSSPFLLFSPSHLTNPQALISQGAFSTLRAGLSTSTGLLPTPGLLLQHSVCSPNGP